MAMRLVEMAAIFAARRSERGGVPKTRLGKVSVIDALALLRGAIETSTCERCVCDIDGSGSVSATDAALVLGFAVGLAVDLSCPACTA